VDERERFLIRYAGSFAPEPIARAEGAWVETASGKRILDFTSGQICSTLGHNHPRIAAAVRAAFEDVVHLNSWMLSEPVLALGERLVGLFPPHLDRVLLLNTGTEANEVALKMAKMHTGRWEVVGLTRSFHGLLSGIASVNFSMAHAGYGPVLPGSFAIPAPYAYRCPVRHCDGACDCTCLEVGFELVDQQSVGALCALVAEPKALPPAPSWIDKPMRWAQLTLVEDDPVKYDAGFWLDYFARTHADAVCLSAGGCVAYYPTAVPFQDRKSTRLNSSHRL